MLISEITKQVVSGSSALMIRPRKDMFEKGMPKHYDVKPLFTGSKKGWVIIDLTTANAMNAVYHALSTPMKEKWNTIPVNKLINFTWSHVSNPLFNPARYKPVFTAQRRAVLSRVFRDAWADGRGEHVPSRRMRFNPIDSYDSLYDELKAAGVKIDHHESDLYFERTPLSRSILAQYPTQKKMSSSFLNQITHNAWIEVPFAYMPYWRARQHNPIKLSYNEAIRIQDKQIEHYSKSMGRSVRAKVKAQTKPCPFDPNKPMPSWDINALVPRGADIESIIGLRYSTPLD